MRDEAGWCGSDVDVTTPNIARMNDYFIGGKDNFAVDRQAAEELLAIAPEIRVMAVENQAFYERVVRFLIGRGIRQFVTVGSGLPTQRNTHEVAQSLVADARVVYVEHDPVVLAHARALLETNPATVVVDGHVLRPGTFLADEGTRRMINFSEPLAFLIPGLQFLADDEGPFESVAWLRGVMPKGSFLVISHVVFDDRPELAKPIVDIYRKILRRSDGDGRTRAEVLDFFAGLELVDPGLVYIREWRPDGVQGTERPEAVWVIGGVGRKP